jgi:Catalytic LigB subunit of aromatic ring-opening dioxygenase
MAEIVLGIATSHGPMLATPPEKWGLRAEADRRNRQHAFREKTYDFESLLRARGSLENEIGLEVWKSRHAQCQRALDALARSVRAAAPDVVIVAGNDQREIFQEDLTPAITLYRGETIENVPSSPEARARMGPGIAIAEEGHCPPEGASYPGAPELAAHLLRSLVEDEFDVAQASSLRGRGIPHAYGFVYRRLFSDAPPASVPLIMNVGYPDNRPTLRRALALGRALARAVRGWDRPERVALIASGGLSHFVIDEELDRTVLSALERGDEDALAGMSEELFRSGTAEIKNWLPVASAMHALGRRFHLVDYVPCYRSEAGTGNAMGFAYWE